MNGCSGSCSQGRGVCICRRRVSEIDLDARQAEKAEAEREAKLCRDHAQLGMDGIPSNRWFGIASTVVVAAVVLASIFFRGAPL